MNCFGCFKKIRKDDSIYAYLNQEVNTPPTPTNPDFMRKTIVESDINNRMSNDQKKNNSKILKRPHRSIYDDYISSTVY